MAAHPLGRAHQRRPFASFIPDVIQEPRIATLNFSSDSTPYVMFEDEINIECKVEDHVQCPETSFQGMTSTDEALEARASLKTLRTACLGDSFNAQECWSKMQDFRNKAYPKVVAWAGHSPKVRWQSMCTAPKVHHWQSGGGLRASVDCGVGGEQKAFFYRHNYKAAGWTIEANLNFNAVEEGFRGEHDWWQNYRCHEYEQLKTESFPTLFTFVREPISKFVSGYKEIGTRLGNTTFKELLDAKIGTPAHARAFLDIVFHGTCDQPHVIPQSYILMNKACESKFDFIGKIENFDEDWKAVSKEGGCIKPMGRKNSEAPHESDLPKYEVYEKSMYEALRANDNALYKALCWWLLPDFALFDYSLPPECASADALRIALADVKKG